jgi:hypothetical protein
MNIPLTNIITFITAGLLACISSATSFGHGNPIQVNVDNSHLIVARGLSLSYGYVDLASDPHEDAALDFGPNQKLRSTYPGYDITGINPAAPLQFEMLSRPDFTTAGYPARWLWFWDATSQRVTSVPNDATFNIVPLFGSGLIQVKQSSLIVGPVATMASPIGPYLATDQHLLVYEVQNYDTGALGAYAIFARLTSPGLTASDPFLLVFRYGAAAEDFSIAANAVNRAASPPGDYNFDDHVDAADYVVWRDSVNSTTLLAADGSGNGVVDSADYDLWRANFGYVVPASAVAAGLQTSVPEPGVLWIVLTGSACMAVFCRSRSRPLV